MGLGSKFAIYLVAFFGMILLALYHILPVNYFGEIVIVLFVSGLVYAWLNAWRQTDRIIEMAKSEEKGAATESSEPSESSNLQRNEEPIAA